MMPPDEPDIALHMPALELAASKARFIIELGCGDGHGSMRALTAGFRKSPNAELYVSVDLRTDRPKYGLPAEDWWHLVHGDTGDRTTVESAREIAGGRVADLIFIDTNHTYEHLSRELAIWGELANRSTVWLFHDTWMGGSYQRMTDAIKEYASLRRLQYMDLSQECNGLGWMSCGC